jgi:5-formyltetrahydrofolate cyclo-ligase
MPEHMSRQEIMSWRPIERRRLIQQRLELDPNDRSQRVTRIAARLSQHLGPLSGRIVSVYWPYRGEPDLRPWMRTIAQSGARCALPVVIKKNAPLVFRAWRHGDRLVPGVWNIPVPAEGEELVPDIIIAPVVGFDRACFRLGYGGGFFDRTLSALSPRPALIGVGFAQAAIPSIHPLPHDIPMDIIITEHDVSLAAKA